MKHLVFGFTLCLLLHLSNNIAYAQNTWNRVGADNNFEITHQVVKPFNNNIFSNGLTVYYGDSIPYVTTELFKYDFSGNLLFDTLLGNVDTTYVIGDLSINSGNTFCNGGEVRYPNQPAKPFNQFALFYNLDNNKFLKYIHPIDTVGVTFIRRAIKLNENRYCLLIESCPIPTGGPTTSANLIIIDSLGNVLHQKSWLEPGFWYRPSALHQYENNYFLVINKILINQVQDPSNYIIYKLDSLFNAVDSFKTTTNNWYTNFSTAVFPNGDFILGGVYSDAWEPDGDVWQKKYIRKFDKNLNIIWTRYFGKRSLNTTLTNLKITSDGNIVGTGTDGIVTITTNGDTIGHITGCVFKFTANSDSLWMHNYQAIDDPMYGDNNELLNIEEMPDGGYVACGKSVAYLPGRQRGWMMRLGIDGCLNPDCISSTKEIENNNYFTLFPNPSSEILNITNSDQLAYYKIFQFDGKLVEAGKYFPIKLNELSSGLYFLQITTKAKGVINLKFVKE